VKKLDRNHKRQESISDLKPREPPKFGFMRMLTIGKQMVVEKMGRTFVPPETAEMLRIKDELIIIVESFQFLSKLAKPILQIDESVPDYAEFFLSGEIKRVQQYQDDYTAFRLEHNARLGAIEQLLAPHREQATAIPPKKVKQIKEADLKLVEIKEQYDVSKKRLIYGMRRVNRQKTEAFVRVIRNMCAVLRSMKPKWEIKENKTDVHGTGFDAFLGQFLRGKPQQSTNSPTISHSTSTSISSPTSTSYIQPLPFLPIYGPMLPPDRIAKAIKPD